MLDVLLRRRSCEKLIKYQARTFSFDVKFWGDVIDLSNIKTGVQTIEEAGVFVKEWDDYQYGICKLHQHIKNTDPKFEIYRRKMEDALKTITRLRIALKIFEKSPRRGKKRLEAALDQMEALLAFDRYSNQLEREITGEGISTRVKIEPRLEKSLR